MAELIRKQPTPPRLPSGERAATEALLAELLGEDPPEPPPHRVNRAARAVGLVGGALALLAVVAIVSVLAGHRAAGPVPPSAEPPVDIDGSAALRPDLLSAELGGPGADAPGSAGAARPTGQAGPSRITPPPDLVTGPKPQVDVVRRFYELLPAEPAAAAGLLSAELIGGSTADFAAAWSRVRAVRVESASLRPDGSVLAVVSVQEADGRWMRVEQLFRLTDTTTPRIVGSEVLSAQRS
ncbi:hypothetical protein [Saccharothrix coeruleofusca]|uniref:Uncharacterized protein n=1 Tax=Saccharothrix coeruleofusca TaxID=33919 RepID=A0A918AMV4_9PSEU|nr:hypothetical protein [Saccharothrix coeruleofusca]GGP58733.1 hypothetical protein GCM10010185_34010 [Saccharothrix coeruleofusca]